MKKKEIFPCLSGGEILHVSVDGADVE